MTEFLKQLRDLLEEHGVTLETSNGINFSSMEEDVYINKEKINPKVIGRELSRIGEIN